MRAIVQRVSQAAVEVNGKVTGSIDKGLLVYLGVGENDTNDQADFISKKISELRVFEDNAGKMNLSVADVGGSVLIISNFTLYGDCQKGRRPSFDKAANPELAEKLYDKVSNDIEALGLNVQKGIFAEHMNVKSVNDGPVNFIIEKKQPDFE
ncbi:MAG: D-tyrosyl-tRNA(Tyr) deacylase [Sedimentisphaerales bacterium]|nr:D-tyrosyl-tRNA(Tyr) deacylase [Sedimentisphaerales bacterium]